MYMVEIQNCLYARFSLRHEAANNTDWLDWTALPEGGTEFESEMQARIAAAFLNEKLHTSGRTARVVIRP